MTRSRAPAVKSYVWKAYLPIGKPRIRASKADIDFFAERGVNAGQLAGALAVLRRLRRDVLPLLECFEHRPIFTWLVHDRRSGVPTRGNGIFIDLTLYFEREFDARGPLHWFKFVRPIDLAATEDVGGIDRALFVEGYPTPRSILIGQCAWYWSLLCAFRPEVPDVEVLKHVGQYLHFFSNMSQLGVR